MYIYCPNCHSTNIKKNGHTHYGKQNHCCKCCGHGFVLENRHTKSPHLKNQIKQQALKERISLRGIYRIFEVSFTSYQSIKDLIEDAQKNKVGLEVLFIESGEQLPSEVKNKLFPKS